MKTITKVIVVLLGCFVFTGCPSGNDREFGVYGIYYSFDPAGYVWAEYRVPSSKKSTTSPDQALRMAAGDLQKVVRGETPLLNSRAEDLKAARFVAIAGYYSDFDSKTQKSKDERFGVVFFAISDLARIAKSGPTHDDDVTSEVGPEERVFDFAKRWAATKTKEPNQALQHNDPSCHESCLRTPRASRDRG